MLQESVAHLLTRPVGRPPKEVRRYYASFSYQAGTWDKPRRVVAKVEWHPGELYPTVGFIVTNLSRPAEKPALSALGHATHAALGRVVAETDAAILEEAGARSPLWSSQVFSEV